MPRVKHRHRSALLGKGVGPGLGRVRAIRDKAPAASDKRCPACIRANRSCRRHDHAADCHKAPQNA